MSLSILLAATSIYILFSAPAAAMSELALREAQKQNLFLSAWIGSFYMAAGLTAIWYPGTAWLDPEFRSNEQVDEPAQLYIFGGGLVMLWAGWVIERQRLGRETSTGKQQKAL